jgi:hypothetical protein
MGLFIYAMHGSMAPACLASNGDPAMPCLHGFDMLARCCNETQQEYTIIQTLLMLFELQGTAPAAQQYIIDRHALANAIASFDLLQGLPYVPKLTLTFRPPFSCRHADRLRQPGMHWPTAPLLWL